jgi:hypothetical protein
LLEGLADEFAGYGFDSYHHYEMRVLHRRINWNLAVDTFLESYRIGVLHRETISPLFMPTGAPSTGSAATYAGRCRAGRSASCAHCPSSNGI